ncbi:MULTISPECIES: TonB-dependent receptor [unclassified Nitrobacter]|uniref:TonB-dependent receptor n=1 Tax=unclassified Nitrobacter TaxID=2620411 RepID=UPI000ABEB295|nr:MULTISPECIES: TonB-dependent receptor [unclassified Nitrobacter]MBN9147941.1 TonB-dependent receptor [Nitrobacter sp.]MBN9489897.1 TonB-dependent receptor [Alphaproteobacteria bacterium]
MAFGSAWVREGSRAAALAGVSLLALNTALHAQPANVQPPTARPSGMINVSVAAGSLESGLLSLGRQTNLRMLYPSNLTAGKRTAGVSGQVSPQQAVTQLLAGTGLRASFTGRNTVQVFDPSTPVAGGALPAGAIALDTIDVQGANNPNALIGNLPPEYAGGQVARGGQLGILGNRDLMDTPFSQTNYTSKTMQNQQSRFISDALNNDPTARAVGPSGGYNGFNIRGFQVSNSQVLFNGLQGVAPASNEAVMAESFERIEVFKGPSSLLNGMVGNAGGVINLVPKRAGDEPLTQITPDYGMNSQFGGHVDVGRRFGDNKEFGARFNGVYRNGDTTINHQSREQKLATLALDYRGERLRVTADLGYQKQLMQGIRRVTRAVAGIQIPAAPDSRTNWFDPAELSDGRAYYGAIRGEYDLTDKWTAFVALGASDKEITRFSTNRTIINTQGDLAAGNLSFSGSLDKRTQETLEAGVRGRFDTGPVQHQVALAYSTYHQLGEFGPSTGASVPFPASNIYNPVFGPRPDMSLRPGFDSNLTPFSDTTQSSAVLADTLSILNERVQLTAGGRLQEIKSTNFTSGVVTSSYDEGAISPSVGLVVKPWQNISLYASYIEGLQQGPVAPPGTANQGQVFAPYKAEQYETGAKFDFGGLAATLAFYQLALPNAYTNPNTNVFGIDGEQRNRGVDFNIFGEVVSGIRILGGAAYIDSVLLNTVGGIDDGNRGIAVPKWRVVFGAEWDTPFIPGLTLTGRAIHNGSVYVDTANTQSIPAWTRLDIGARYRIERPGAQPIIIRASIENVLGSNYWEATDTTLVLNDPRTFKLSASFNF